MKPRLLSTSLVLFILLITFSACSSQPTSTGSEPPKVLLLQTDGPISSSIADYLERGLDQAQNEQAELVVYMINTPGGAIDIMTRMVQDIRNSPVPVIVYVAPRGSMAGSAGTVITLSGQASAMAPDTAIGAASPVDISGQDIPTTEAQKIKEITQATVRSLTQNRPAAAQQLAQDTIGSAKAVSAQEALQIGLIDFIASDVNDLLQQANGFTVQLNDGPVTLNTQNAVVESVPETFVDSLLNLLTNPNFVFILLNVGVLAILFEISNPGGWLAGFIGVVCLLLAIYGLGVLPVNWFGLLFIVVAFVLFVLDIKAPTHGALTVAGIASFIAGALILFNTVRPPEFQPISIPLVVVMSFISGGLFAVIIGFALRAQRTPIRAGNEIFIGRTGIVRTDLNPRGQVQVSGELWTAEMLPGESPALRGDLVQIEEVDGLRLRVRHAQPAEEPNA